jgi:hypothetical protein
MNPRFLQARDKIKRSQEKGEKKKKKKNGLNEKGEKECELKNVHECAELEKLVL